jgi:hypothetical protein
METGTILVIGAMQCGSIENKSGVYTYDLIEDSWVQRGSILEVVDLNIDFGYAVALSSSGDVLVVGAPLKSSGKGCVYTYDLVENNWVQRGDVLEDEGSSIMDNFGYAVALSSNGEILAIGAPGKSFYLGCVYIYDLVEDIWVQRGSVLEAIDGVGFDLFGSALALSFDGTILVVGAPGVNSNKGGVYTYDLVEDIWVQRGSVLEAVDAEEGDYFGCSVALSSDGMILIVGAIGKNSGTGCVYIYDLVEDIWVQRGSVLEAVDAEEGDYFGYSVATSINGGLLIIGAPYKNGLGTIIGCGYLYEFITSFIQDENVLEPNDPVDGGKFAISVAMANLYGDFSGFNPFFSLNNNLTIPEGDIIGWRL